MPPIEDSRIYRDGTLSEMRLSRINLNKITDEEVNKWCKEVYFTR